MSLYDVKIHHYYTFTVAFEVFSVSFKMVRNVIEILINTVHISSLLSSEYSF